MTPTKTGFTQHGGNTATSHAGWCGWLRGEGRKSQISTYIVEIARETKRARSFPLPRDEKVVQIRLTWVMKEENRPVEDKGRNHRNRNGKEGTAFL